MLSWKTGSSSARTKDQKRREQTNPRKESNKNYLVKQDDRFRVWFGGFNGQRLKADYFAQTNMPFLRDHLLGL